MELVDGTPLEMNPPRTFSTAWIASFKVAQGLLALHCSPLSLRT